MTRSETGFVRQWPKNTVNFGFFFLFFFKTTKSTKFYQISKLLVYCKRSMPLAILKRTTQIVGKHCSRSMKLFSYHDVCKLVGLDNNSIKNISQQSNFSIQEAKMKRTETNYLPGPPMLLSTPIFNFVKMHP